MQRHCHLGEAQVAARRSRHWSQTELSTMRTSMSTRALEADGAANAPLRPIAQVGSRTRTRFQQLDTSDDSRVDRTRTRSLLPPLARCSRRLPEAARCTPVLVGGHDRERPVDVSVSATLVPAIAPPVASRTVPKIVPVTDCAAAAVGDSRPTMSRADVNRLGTPSRQQRACIRMSPDPPWILILSALPQRLDAISLFARQRSPNPEGFLPTSERAEASEPRERSGA